MSVGGHWHHNDPCKAYEEPSQSSLRQSSPPHTAMNDRMCLRTALTQTRLYLWMISASQVHTVLFVARCKPCERSRSTFLQHHSASNNLTSMSHPTHWSDSNQTVCDEPAIALHPSPWPLVCVGYVHVSQICVACMCRDQRATIAERCHSSRHLKIWP